MRQGDVRQSHQLPGTAKPHRDPSHRQTQDCLLPWAPSSLHNQTFPAELCLPHTAHTVPQPLVFSLAGVPTPAPTPQAGQCPAPPQRVSVTHIPRESHLLNPPMQPLPGRVHPWPIQLWLLSGSTCLGLPLNGGCGPCPCPTPSVPVPRAHDILLPAPEHSPECCLTGKVRCAGG